MFTMPLFRLGNGTWYAPAVVKPAFGAGGRDCPTTKPKMQIISNPVNSHEMGPFLIGALLGSRGPSHIPLFIMTVVVNSIQRMFRRWATTDLRKKFWKGLESKFDAATAIAMKARKGLCSASAFGSRISLKFRGTPAFAVNATVSRYEQSLHAPARLSFPTQQIRRKGSEYQPTLTFAEPRLVMANPSRITENHDELQIQFGDVAKARIGWNWLKNNVIFSVDHDVFSFVENRLARLAKGLNHLWRAVFILPNIKRIGIENMQEVTVSH